MVRERHGSGVGGGGGKKGARAHLKSDFRDTTGTDGRAYDNDRCPGGHCGRWITPRRAREERRGSGKVGSRKRLQERAVDNTEANLQHSGNLDFDLHTRMTNEVIYISQIPCDIDNDLGETDVSLSCDPRAHMVEIRTRRHTHYHH